MNHQAILLFDLVREFCLDSGQSVSLDKSDVYFSPHISQADRNCIQSTMGIRGTDQLGKYLGVPLRTERVNRNTYHFIIQKIQAKLLAGGR